MERATSSAVPASRVPSRPERLTTEASSSAVRAFATSSVGVKPSMRSTAFAELLSTVTSHPNTSMKNFWGSTTTRVTRMGSAMAQFLGTSSLKTICVKVATMKAAVVAMPTAAASGTPVQPRPSAKRVPRLGPVRKPAMRLVTVIPSWAPERLVEVFLRLSSMVPASLSPDWWARWTA